MKFLIITFILISANCFFGYVHPDKAKNLFDSGLYHELVEYTAEMPNDIKTDPGTFLFRAIALYRTGRYRESRRLLERIAEITNDPPLKDRALYFLALNDIKTENLISASLIISRLTNSSIPEISENSDTIIKSLIHYRLNESELDELAGYIKDTEILSYIEQSRNALKILAVLPLTGVDSRSGRDILTGIEFAIRHLRRDDLNIVLDVVNSESRIPAMIKKVLERTNYSTYNLTVGELRSDPTASLAGLTTMLNIPLISPTAAASGISKISNSVFQLNTSSYTLGRTAAEFAIDSLKYRTFAILAPMTDDGNESVAGFTDKVIERGCAVISTEWYFDHFNLSRQLQRIRERALTIDSLDTEEYMILDSIKAVPAGVIEGFFLPVPNSDAESVLSQVAYHNFSAGLLGTYGWDDTALLNKLSSNADGLVFVREKKYDTANARYNDFVYRFNREMNRNPRILEINGFSMMEMIITLMNQYPGKTLNSILESIDTYESVAGTVRFDSSGSNQASGLFKYTTRRGITQMELWPKTLPDTLALAKKYYNTGHVHTVMRNDSSAVEYYLRSMEEFRSVLAVPDSLEHLDKNIASLKRRLGNSYFNLRDYENSAQFFREVLKADPRDRESSFKLAVSISEEDPDMALIMLQEFTNDAKFSADAFYHIGLIYLDDGEMQLAEDNFAVSAELGNSKAGRILDELTKEEEEEQQEIEFEW